MDTNDLSCLPLGIQSLMLRIHERIVQAEVRILSGTEHLIVLTSITYAVWYDVY